MTSVLRITWRNLLNLFPGTMCGCSVLSRLDRLTYSRSAVDVMASVAVNLWSQPDRQISVGALIVGALIDEFLFLYLT